jgi:glycosyltransferase involved in cell wall biosynthesis
MKILLQGRSDLFESPCGDTSMLLKIQEHLSQAGHEIKVSCDLRPNLKGFDVVNIFNHYYVEEAYIQLMHAKKSSKPIVLTTIYMNYSYYDKLGRRGIAGFITRMLPWSKAEYIKGLRRLIRKKKINYPAFLFLIRGYYNLLKSIFLNSDMLLVSSESELKRIFSDFNINDKEYIVAPNAFSKTLIKQDVSITKDLEKFRNCVLSVAYLQPRKCQLELVRALKNSPYTLVLIGSVIPGAERYFEKVKKELGPNQYWLGRVEYNKLAKFYKLAKVHCLISWMEVSGLASLEAGLMGCNIVVTDYGDTRGNFGDLAYYCAPNSLKSIRKAVDKAYKNDYNPELRKLIENKYNWCNEVQQTIKAYEKAISLKE